MPVKTNPIIVVTWSKGVLVCVRRNTPMRGYRPRSPVVASALPRIAKNSQLFVSASVKDAVVIYPKEMDDGDRKKLMDLMMKALDKVIEKQSKGGGYVEFENPAFLGQTFCRGAIVRAVDGDLMEISFLDGGGYTVKSLFIDRSDLQLLVKGV